MCSGKHTFPDSPDSARTSDVFLSSIESGENGVGKPKCHPCLQCFGPSQFSTRKLLMNAAEKKTRKRMITKVLSFSHLFLTLAPSSYLCHAAVQLVLAPQLPPADVLAIPCIWACTVHTVCIICTTKRKTQNYNLSVFKSNALFGTDLYALMSAVKVGGTGTE